MDLISPIGNLNRGVKGIWILLGCLIRDTFPTHQHSPVGEPDREDTTHQPAISHHLFSHTSGPGGHPLIWNHMRCLPAALDFTNLTLKVNNIKS